MRTETIERTYYSFDELSEDAKDKALQEWIKHEDYQFIFDDAIASMKGFCDAFGITLNDYTVSSDAFYSDASWSFGYLFEGEEMTGQRLATWIWNNVPEIWSRKYLKHGELRDEKPCFSHRMMKVRQIVNECPNKGKWSVSYYSNIKRVENYCPFTGVIYDCSLLDCIYEFIGSPDNRTLEDLINESFSELFTAIENEIESRETTEYLSEMSEANNYEFTEEGEMI